MARYEVWTRHDAPWSHWSLFSTADTFDAAMNAYIDATEDVARHPEYHEDEASAWYVLLYGPTVDTGAFGVMHRYSSDGQHENAIR